MGDETVKRAARYSVGYIETVLPHVHLQSVLYDFRHNFVLGILQDCFSAWEWCVGRQMKVLRSCPGSPHPIVVLHRWLILIAADKQHWLLGFCLLMSQSNTDRPDNMAQQLAGVDQNQVRCRCAIDRNIDRDPKTLD